MCWTILVDSRFSIRPSIPISSRPGWQPRSSVTQIGSRVCRMARLPINHSSDYTFQILSLRHAEQHWMIAGLAALFDNLQTAARVQCCVLDDFQKQLFVDVIRSGTGDQHSARDQKL